MSLYVDRFDDHDKVRVTSLLTRTVTNQRVVRHASASHTAV